MSRLFFLVFWFWNVTMSALYTGFGLMLLEHRPISAGYLLVCGGFAYLHFALARKSMHVLETLSGRDDID